MPATPPVQPRRNSMRTRIASAAAAAAAISSQSNPDSARSGTRAQQQQTQQATSPQPSSPTAARKTSQPIIQHSRPGRPRKEPVPAPLEDPDKPRKGRGRPPKTREASTEPTTPPASGSSSAEHDAQSPPPSSPSAKNKDKDKDMLIDIDKEDLSSTSQPVTRASSAQRQTRQQSASAPKETDYFSRHSNDNSSRNGSSEALEQSRDRAESNHSNGDREIEEVSSESENGDGDAESDDDHQERESTKEKQPKTTSAPFRRRLRSSRLMPSVAAHLAVDSTGLGVDHIMDEYTEEQQLLQANTNAAEALTRLFRRGIVESEGLHPDMVDAQDYELIRHTFGDIEELNFNEAETLSAPDESSTEDDELTRELKRKHRRGKRELMDTSAEYKAVKQSMAIKLSAQLDAEEAQINAGTHPDLLAELKAIENRREARARVMKAQKDYVQRMWDINFQAVCKAAHDQYRVDKDAARRNIIELVQKRMNRIRQELAQSRIAEGKPPMRRLTYVRTVDAAEYDSCGESCSSYDSYTSSGSDCSDCEICRPTPQLQIPQLKKPKGLSRKEIAVDLGFLYPELGPSNSRRNPPDDTTPSRDRPGLSRQYSSDGEEYSHRQKNGRNQQYMIDRLNDERRRKRRVLDREMQNKVIYTNHTGEGGLARDMDLDQYQYQNPDNTEREPSSTRPATEPVSRPHSPNQTRGVARPSPHNNDKVHQPRFLPGFSPSGMQRAKRPKDPIPGTGVMQRFRFRPQNRWEQPANRWDPQDFSRYGSPTSLPANQEDRRLFSLVDREAVNAHGGGGRSGMQDPFYLDLNSSHPGANQGPRPHFVRHIPNTGEPHEAPIRMVNFGSDPRSPVPPHGSPHHFAARHAPDDVYPYDGDRKSRFRHAFAPRKGPPNPPYPA
ncbi:hypothetical protein BC939DRAFT_439624 [Gamsiella multidivaricata]|uniref:uncharacterized protein n=1 Tax=Gamsiella multidivaricata TaxID=101098 RepID=UPI0022210760|nr:uncharacterized protein BC939DRAFT_439624 [Gamsiella multidivaricata]KAG0357066.1 hypothetical protein BGZ54_000487 [Gamsiella multidivaricata]KAI7830522.1 hypothetical protein BC939DRAFT_439624 [Gamsiella multidivaricata]